MSFLAAAGIGEALQNTVVGLVTVFAVLAFLVFIISLFKYVNRWETKKEKAAKAEQAAAAPAQAAPAAAPAAAAPAPAAPARPAGPGTMANSKVHIADEVDGTVAAVILAAVAEECGGNFKVTSIKKSS